jgi:RHS repeat-associated protein
VTVGHNGLPTDIKMTDAVRKMTPDEIAASVMRAIQKAQSKYPDVSAPTALPCWSRSTSSGMELCSSSRFVQTGEHEPRGLRPLTQRERVSIRDAPQEWVDERFYSIVSDIVGTPTELVDNAGDITWQARSTLWGELSNARSVQAETPLRFPGQYFDRETGLHYNYQRYYDPELGRYNSDDPLGLAPAPNPRTYVTNPTRYVDPLGLTPAPGGSHGPGTGNHTNPPPPQVPGPISMDDAVDFGARHVGGTGRVVESGSGGYQFISQSTDAAGRPVTSVARFDINPNNSHVQQYGPHLNLETQVGGRPVRSGPYADPHIPIDPTTIRPGDIP